MGRCRRKLPRMLLAALTAAAIASAAPAPADTAPANAGTITVAALPLKRGYYVASDTACADASNATVVLVRRDGMSGSRDFCEFTQIEQTGPTTYRVTQACADFSSADSPETSTVTFTIPNETSFVSASEHGWEHSARYCPQPSMPPGFRENDIRDG